MARFSIDIEYSWNEDKIEWTATIHREVENDIKISGEIENEAGLTHQEVEGRIADQAIEAIKKSGHL